MSHLRATLCSWNPVLSQCISAAKCRPHDRFLYILLSGSEAHHYCNRLQLSHGVVQATRTGSAPQIIQLYQGPLVWSEARISNSWKRCHYADRGFWDSATRSCITWYFLENLCVKLDLDAVSGQWRSSPRYGDMGCNVFQRYNPVVSASLPLANWRVPSPPSITMEQVRWKLNSEPYLN
jgi:hypothetical protein